MEPASVMKQLLIKMYLFIVESAFIQIGKICQNMLIIFSAQYFVDITICHWNDLRPKIIHSNNIAQKPEQENIVQLLCLSIESGNQLYL